MSIPLQTSIFGLSLNVNMLLFRGVHSIATILCIMMPDGAAMKHLEINSVLLAALRDNLIDLDTSLKIDYVRGNW